MDIDENDSAADEPGFLFDSAARRILRDADPAGFMAWFQRAAPELASRFIGQLPDDAAFQRGFLTQFARILWNKTPPHTREGLSWRCFPGEGSL